MKYIFSIFFAAANFVLAQDVVLVSDFGAKPNDGVCDIAAIKKAIEKAKEVSAKELVFEAGVYDFKLKTMKSATSMRFEDFEGLSVVGAVNEKGEPATTFLRHYKFENNVHAIPLFAAKNCKNFTLKNVIFDNNPRYTSAGEIMKIEGSRIVIRILDGNPAIDGGIIYCANSWDLKNKKLLHVESLNYGGDATRKAEEYTMHFLNDTDKNLMYIDSPTMAPKVKVGEGISWSYGHKGLQTSFEYCDNLYVENVWTYNSVGFCFETKASHNLRGKNVKFIAPENQLMVCSRDAWKLYACTGDVEIDGMYIEGVRWDGQNAHGSFMMLQEKIDSKTLCLFKEGGAGQVIPVGSMIGFIKDSKTEILCKVKSAELKKGTGKVSYIVTFEEAVPNFVDDKTLCNIYGWAFNSYKVKNSEFRNIAGCASILRNQNTLFEDCVFDNIMYPAILIGAEPQNGEGITPKNITVNRCKFISSGWTHRQGAYGGIGVRCKKLNEKEDYNPDYSVISGAPFFYMRNIKITNNEFVDCGVGIQAEGVNGLIIDGNVFKNTKKPIVQSDNLNAKIQKH